MSSVVIVEDDTELRESLADYLSACGDTVTGVGSAVELYQLIGQNNYDVAVLDVNLPHYDGLSICAYLAEKTDMALIMMTVQGAVEDRVRGYNSGADLYMVKPVDCEELAAAVTSLSRRRKRRSAGEASPAGEWCLDRPHFRLVAPSGNAVALTRNEIRFLEALAAKAGAITLRSDLQKLLGYDPADVESRALDAAISRLRGKVQSECGVTLPLQTVQGAGYVFSGALKLS